MTVYILYDDAPADFNGEGWRVLAVYKSREKAMRVLTRLQRRDPYANQYVDVEPYKVR